MTHYYSIDSKTTPIGFKTEGGPGIVLSVAQFPQIEAACPELVKVGIWRSGTMSYIGNKPPNGFVRKESFYCSPRQFYCGANFLLRRMDKIGGGDIFYPSGENEANQQLIGPGVFRSNSFTETPCWIWKRRNDTMYDQVKAAGSMIWGGYQKTGAVNYYTLQRHLTPASFNKTSGPGYVVLQELYDSYFKKQCPDLIPMRIWHGVNGKGQTVTWIGKDGAKPPAVLKTKVEQEQRQFYCSPRLNYCGANFLLRRMDKVGGSAFYYPQKEKEAQQMLSSPLYKNTKWSESVCHIWERW